MNKFVSCYWAISMAVFVLNAPTSFAGFGDGNLPPEMIKEVFTYLKGPDLNTVAHVDVESRDIAHEVDNEHWKAKAAKVDAILNKFGDFIALSGNPKWSDSKDSISPVAPTQELWIEVLGSNPAHFREKKYCPEPGAHRIVLIRGKPVEMCVDFPVDSVIAVDQGKKDSDVEFMAALKRIYSKAGLEVEFRRPTREEYHWADTEGETSPKVGNDPDLGKATPYWEISNKDPKNLSNPSPSGAHQPRSIWDNAPNAFGFRRSGVWEWVEDMDVSGRGLVGGCWHGSPRYAASGYRGSVSPDYRLSDWLSDFGPARLVRTQK
jgi:hypothetical protein